MKITLDLHDEDVAMLERGLVLENQERKEIAIENELQGHKDIAAWFSRDLPLENYAAWVLVTAVEEKIKHQEARQKARGQHNED